MYKVIKESKDSVLLIEFTYINYALALLAIGAIVCCFKNWLIVGIVLICVYLGIYFNKNYKLAKYMKVGNITEVTGSKYSFKSPKIYKLVRKGVKNV